MTAKSDWLHAAVVAFLFMAFTTCSLIGWAHFVNNPGRSKEDMARQVGNEAKATVRKKNQWLQL